MSDAFTDISREEKEKLDYFAATLTISKYVVDKAIKRPSGEVRDKYLKLAYSEIDHVIKTQVEDMIYYYECDKDA